MLSKKDKLAIANVIAKKTRDLKSEIEYLKDYIKTLEIRLFKLEKSCCKTKAIGTFVEIEPDGHQSNGEKLDDRLI